MESSKTKAFQLFYENQLIHNKSPVQPVPGGSYSKTGKSIPLIGIWPIGINNEMAVVQTFGYKNPWFLQATQHQGMQSAGVDPLSSPTRLS